MVSDNKVMEGDADDERDDSNMGDCDESQESQEDEIAVEYVAMQSGANGDPRGGDWRFDVKWATDFDEIRLHHPGEVELWSRIVLPICPEEILWPRRDSCGGFEVRCNTS